MISEVQTITRFLASVSALETDIGSKEIDVTEYYTTQYVYPVRDIFVVARDFCVKTGLIEHVKNQLLLSDLGRTYLSLGDKKDKAYILEPNQKQKSFLSKKVFLISERLDQVKKILYAFNRGANGELYLSKIEAETLEDQNFLGLLLQLEILIEKKDIIELAPQYIDLLTVAVSDSVMVLTPEAFKKLEIEKSELSKIAEEYVLESEYKRLKESGAIKQAKNIDHVAIRNIAAGYDIASFGNKNSESHDRFIEVKAGKATPIKFFFSRNEFKIASRLKNRYYIYYVCIKNKKAKEIYIFQNPTEGIMKDPNFEVYIDIYEVSEK